MSAAALVFALTVHGAGFWIEKQGGRSWIDGQTDCKPELVVNAEPLWDFFDEFHRFVWAFFSDDRRSFGSGATVEETEKYMAIFRTTSDEFLCEECQPACDMVRLLKCTHLLALLGPLADLPINYYLPVSQR